MKTRGGSVVKQEPGLKKAAVKGKGASGSAIMVIPDEKLVKKLSKFADPAAQSNFDELSKIKMGAPRSICWDTIKKLGLDAKVREYMENGGFQSFFEIQEPAYTELTLEFLASFKVDPSKKDPNEEDHFVFRLMGHKQTPSLNTFNVLLGCVSDEEDSLEEYATFPQLTPPEFNPHKFWEQLTGEPVFDSKMAKGSAIEDYSLRYLHKLVSGTIFARENQANVTLLDLVALWSMVKKQKLNLGHWFGEYLLGYQSKKLNGIFCGSLVTRIAGAIGVFKPEDTSRLTLACYPDPLNLRTLQYMGLCKQVNRKWVLSCDISTLKPADLKKRKSESDMETLLIESGSSDEGETEKDAAYYQKCLHLTNEDILIQLKAQKKLNARQDKQIEKLQQEMVFIQRSHVYLHNMVDRLRKICEMEEVLEFDENTLQYTAKNVAIEPPEEFKSSFNLNESAVKEPGSVPPKEPEAVSSSAPAAP
ncbi:hypothetical protein M5689_004639 [Euphorbia peplus]|nr:hypothetical protein M5689_004639 [Euphorbia peplus]